MDGRTLHEHPDGRSGDLDNPAGIRRRLFLMSSLRKIVAALFGVSVATSLFSEDTGAQVVCNWVNRSYCTACCDNRCYQTCEYCCYPGSSCWYQNCSACTNRLDASCPP